MITGSHMMDNLLRHTGNSTLFLHVLYIYLMHKGNMMALGQLMHSMSRWSSHSSINFTAGAHSYLIWRPA